MGTRVQDGSEGWKEGDHVAWGQSGTELLKVSLLRLSATTVPREEAPDNSGTISKDLKKGGLNSLSL